MSNRPAPLAAERQIEMGAQVGRLRAAGLSWKTIEKATGMERTQLWRCVRRMQQKTGRMQHPEACAERDPR